MSFAVLFSLVLSVLHRLTSLVPPPGRGEPVAAAWYTGWHASGTKAFPLSAISWDKYNTLIYSFAITTPSASDLSLNGSDPPLLPDFVYQAHAHGVAAHVAIGGWGGGLWFSPNVATPENRTAFVQSVAEFAETYELDGINFDWEFPNKQGIGCNAIGANDTQNFLSFLQELRAEVGPQLTLSAAVSIIPFNNVSGDPSKDLSGFAEVLDYIAIMDYDVWGGWSSTVGPNSPLNDACATHANQVGSAVSAVKAWTAAGIPVNQIVLGVPSYGHSFSVPPPNAFVDGSETDLAAYPKFNASNKPLGDAWDSSSSVDACGVLQGPGGTFNLWGLIDGGFLTTEGHPAPGIHYRYDTCSHTPYVYNETSQVMVSFDNARSFAAKGRYIKETGLQPDLVVIDITTQVPVLLGSAPLLPSIQTLASSWPWPHFPRSDDPSVGVDQQTYDDLVRYTKYASGAYQVLCPRPMGNTLIAQFQDIITSTKGFIARDDNREEFVVAFKGSSDTTTILLDASIILAPLKGPGLPPLDPSAVSRSAEPRAHVGFLLGYNSVAQKVLDELAPQLRGYPSYKIVACGHSLGVTGLWDPLRVLLRSLLDIRFLGGVSRYTPLVNLAQETHLLQSWWSALSGLKELIDAYTWLAELMSDGVPTMIPTQLGYRHFGAEYWQFTEPGAPRNVKRFEGGEDPNGSGNIPSTGVNPAHWVYFLQHGIHHVQGYADKVVLDM